MKLTWYQSHHQTWNGDYYTIGWVATAIPHEDNIKVNQYYWDVNSHVTYIIFSQR